MAGIIARRIITAECGGFDVKSVARIDGRARLSFPSRDADDRSFLTDPRLRDECSR